MIGRYLKYFLILLFTAVFNRIYAQSPQADAKLDRTSIRIGEQTKLHLSIKFHVNDKVEFPLLADSISGKIQIVNSKADTSFDKQDVSIETINKHYTVTSFDSGAYTIPSYAFKTNAGLINTPPLTLQVTPVAVDTTKAIYDIKQPLTVKYTFADWLRDNWPWVVGVMAALLIIAAIIYYFIKRPKKVIIAEPPKPVVPVHIIALQKLKALKDKKLWQQDQVKQYYIELSDIIREYLESRYAIKAHEQTSDEIFTSLRYMQINEEDRNTLRHVLILADLVKFAKQKPQPFENEQSMDHAISFVNNTQQAWQPQTIKAEGSK